ncbi:Splicing factor-like protein [Trema orientale]|uniref:Splicing factor-like protein n=1 Tax=Trema orientale TaxID=63057 RepID=A0A2P5AQ23_TREOI|nr:Splicing factor-like protein [Trema orientale]
MAKRLGLQLFVSRLSAYTTNEHLKKLFSRFGEVTEARLIMDPKTRRPKGFGFVTYESEVEAQKALKAMNGRIVDGRLIFVEVAQTRKPGGDALSR